MASNSYKNLKIGLDCANGASWNIANAVFSALGAQTYVVGNEPDGLNVNEGCGSTHIENLQKLVKEKQLDLGFAFDGDADRCIAVDENGKLLDQYPEQAVSTLRRALEVDEALTVSSMFLDVFEISKIVVTGFSAKQMTYSNQQTVEITAISDTDYVIQSTDY